MLKGDIDPAKEVSKDEFDELAASPDNFVGTDHEAREAWLKENGHEVTRENMMDVSLPSNASQRS